jgi:1,4-dihydroxy-2-naphthoate octaprenyltransferase
MDRRRPPAHASRRRRPVLAGTGVAAWFYEPIWWKAALALVVSLALQVAVNYANDYSDGIRGTDDDRVGPMRLVGSGAATPGAVKRAILIAFGVAGVAGVVLAASTAWWLVLVGVSASWRRGSTPAARSPTATSASAR